MEKDMLKRLVAEEKKRYPETRVRDLIKCLYQAEFGCGHMVRETEEGLTYLLSELRTAPETAEPVEEIGAYCRVHLGGLTQTGLSPEELYRLFVRSASVVKGSMRDFREDLEELRLLYPGASDEIDRYIASGCPATHHSEEFRAAYHPAYRVVYGEYLREFIK